MDIQKAVRMAVDTGRVLLGRNESFRSLNAGNSRLIIFSSNLPADVKISVSKRASLAGISTYEFDGSSKELGSICGKPYPVSVISVVEEGDSEILSLSEGSGKQGE